MLLNLVLPQCKERGENQINLKSSESHSHKNKIINSQSILILENICSIYFLVLCCSLYLQHIARLVVLIIVLLSSFLAKGNNAHKIFLRPYLPLIWQCRRMRMTKNLISSCSDVNTVTWRYPYTLLRHSLVSILY